MRAINFKPTQCSHCYRCVRVCQVRAITVKDQQAQIMEDSCILCGDCLNECPQDAKTYVSDLEKVKKWISLGYTVLVSLAPSYHSLFSYDKPGQVFDALKRLGFTAVRETAEGAALVTNEYRKLLEQKTMANIITTCCPSVNLLIETYYPALIPYLAPVISPMIAHARLLKQEYGPESKVVFIGPCISKKAEAYEKDPEMDVDAVLNFHEVKHWLRKEEISIKTCEALPLPKQGPGANRLYPITGGILTSINSSDKSCDGPEQETYRKFSVDGVANCIDLCEDLLTGDLSRCFIEMSACEGGCIQGPMTGRAKLARFRSRVELEEDVEPVPAEDALLHFDTGHFPMSRTFADRSPNKALPTEAQIRKILSKVGKFTAEDELNCGACGYPTCRDKAIAVFQDKAEASMCIPYITEKAQSLANLILETSPNMTIVVDRELKILEFSKAAQKHFHINHKEALETYLFQLIDTDDFEWVFEQKQSLHNKKVKFPDYGFTAIVNLVYIKKHDAVLAILIDITKEEEQAMADYMKKLETVELAQKVIDKQMMVAQQIAGLLGETTAETKVTLANVCKTLLDEEDE